MSDQSVYHEGQYLGEMIEIEGGGHALVDEAGQVVAAVDAEQQPLDPSEFQFTPADQRLAEANARLDEVEQRLDQPLPPPVVELPRDDSDQRWRQQITREFQELESTLGRPLSEAEQWRLMEDHHADHASGQPADLFKSAATVGVHDLDARGDAGHQARTAYGVERLADLDRDARGEEYDPRPERRAETYDLDTHAGRTDAMMDKLAGHEVGDDHVLYDGEE